MFRRRRVITVVLCAVLAATLGSQAGAQPRKKAVRSTETAAVLVRWSEIAEQTIFPATPIPSGQVELGLMTMAMYDAVDESLHARRTASPSAAAAAAAHDVLLDFFPAASTNLAGHLTTTLAGIGAAARSRGLDIGHDVAADLLEDREDDGFPGTGAFDRAPAPGVWRPTAPLPAGAMLTPWLGFMDPLVLRSTRQVDPGSPPAITSRTYALDLAEAQLMGSATSTTRSAEQTAVADFYNFSVPIQLNRVLRDLADGANVATAARLFGLANTSAADSIIACWREKFDEPLWRPITAIREADTDGNRFTFADKGWTPLRATPPYPDWTSGHACLTGAYTSAIQRLLGNGTDIEVTSVVSGIDVSRQYTEVDEIREDAFNARIFLGYHFRAAMVGGYAIADKTERLVSPRFPALR
jgi:hypothetical protein